MTKKQYPKLKNPKAKRLVLQSFRLQGHCGNHKRARLEACDPKGQTLQCKLPFEGRVTGGTGKVLGRTNSRRHEMGEVAEEPRGEDKV